MKQIALLASPVYTQQAQGEETKHIKREAKIEPLLLGPPALSPDVFSFACQIKLSCNTGLPFQIFAAVRQNAGNYTLP